MCNLYNTSNMVGTSKEFWEYLYMYPPYLHHEQHQHCACWSIKIKRVRPNFKDFSCYCWLWEIVYFLQWPIMCISATSVMPTSIAVLILSSCPALPYPCAKFFYVALPIHQFPTLLYPLATSLHYRCIKFSYIALPICKMVLCLHCLTHLSNSPTFLQPYINFSNIALLICQVLLHCILSTFPTFLY
jgi:hypothetical protein